MAQRSHVLILIDTQPPTCLRRINKLLSRKINVISAEALMSSTKKRCGNNIHEVAILAVGSFVSHRKVIAKRAANRKSYSLGTTVRFTSYDCIPYVVLGCG